MYRPRTLLRSLHPAAGCLHLELLLQLPREEDVFYDVASAMLISSISRTITEPASEAPRSDDCFVVLGSVGIKPTECEYAGTSTADSFVWLGYDRDSEVGAVQVGSAPRTRVMCRKLRPPRRRGTPLPLGARSTGPSRAPQVLGVSLSYVD